MKYLLQLNLIPPSDPGPHIQRLDSEMSTEHKTPIKRTIIPESKSSPTPQFDFEVKPGQYQPYKDGPNDVYEVFMGKQHEKNTLSCSPKLPLVTAIDHYSSQPSKAIRDSITQDSLERALPDPPQVRSRHASQSSMHSICPSLTPSLANYVDTGDFGDDEINIGTALTVSCSIPSIVEMASKKLEIEERDSFSDYGHSPPSSVTSPLQALPSPARYICTTGTSLEQHIAQYDSRPIIQPAPRMMCARLPASASENTVFSDRVQLYSRTLHLNESEWLRRTPSPVQCSPLSRSWSPRLRNRDHKPKVMNSNDKYRFSDVGKYSHDDNLVDAVNEQDDTQVAEIKGIGAENDTPNVNTPHASAFPKLAHIAPDPDAKLKSPNRDIILEPCKGSERPVYEALDRPLGNWI